MNNLNQQRTGETKRLICLANSRKLSGRCIAGIENIGTKEQRWIRPVSSSVTGEIPEHDCVYSMADPIRVLDVIDVNLLEPSPKNYQSENWAIAHERPWLYRGRADLVDLISGITTIPNLWPDGESSGKGINDRVSESAIDHVSDSLRLIRVDSIELEVITYDNVKSVPNVRAHFRYGQNDYALRVTDPVCERSFQGKPSGRYEVGPAFMTISLGEPFGGYVYKLIAAIIELNSK